MFFAGDRVILFWFCTGLLFLFKLRVRVLPPFLCVFLPALHLFCLAYVFQGYYFRLKLGNAGKRAASVCTGCYY